ncbi:autotransporter outer membrane beta-barrel domain-containing protein, partial [bacterium]|nr:autotransporter outer membrane beta-barrel domain-containing protein [bacterium]
GDTTFKNSNIKVYNITNNNNINVEGSLDLSTQDTTTSVAGSGNIIIKDSASLNLAQNVQNISNNVQINQNGILSTINDTQDTHTISKVSASDGSKIAFDIGDKLTIADISDTGGNQKFSSIKTNDTELNSIISEGTEYSKDLFGDKTLDFGSNTFNIYHDGKKYTLGQNSADKTKIVVLSAGDPASGLSAAAGDSTTGNYIVSQGEIQEYDGGEVIGDSFEVSGDNLDFNGYKGLIISGNQNANGTTIKTSAYNAISDGNYKATFTSKEGGNLTISASDKDIEIKGTTNGSDNALYIDDSSVVNLSSGSNSIKISGNIEGSEGAKLLASGTNIALNTIQNTAVTQNANNLVLQGQSTNTAWDLTSGTMTVPNDTYLSTSDYSNSLIFNGGSLNLQNNEASQINLSSLEINSSAPLALDVDLASKSADRLAFSNPNDLAINDNLLISDVNLMNTNQIFDKAKYEIPFVSSTLNNQALLGKVQSNVNRQILTPILKYNFGYEETGEEGHFVLSRFNSGKYHDYNPSVMAAPVAAQLGGYFNQLNSYDMAFSNMDIYMNLPSSDRTAYKLRNRYAADAQNITYDPNLYPEQDRGVWFRPYSTFEKVNLKGGVKVDNIGYGTYFGTDSDLIELGHGFNMMLSGYAGYNGSHQNYDFISTYQNGGQLGASSIFYRNNFFTGLTANVGALGAQSSTMYGQDTFGMLGTGVASKTGYNFEFKQGRFIIQPSYLMSYSFVNTFDYTNSANVRIKADPLNAIQIVPGLKFIANTKNGWQPYLGVQMVWNIMDDTKFRANNISLAQLSVKPYIQYGVGIQKSRGERFSGYLQSMIRNGGRNGVALSAGCRWALGK